MTGEARLPTRVRTCRVILRPFGMKFCLQMRHDNFGCQRKISLTLDSSRYTQRKYQANGFFLLFSCYNTQRNRICVCTCTYRYISACSSTCVHETVFIHFILGHRTGIIHVRNYVTATKIAKIFGENAQQEKCA